MNFVQSSRPPSCSPALSFADRRHLASFRGMCGRSCSAMLCLISFCIILLLESAAHGRPKADDRLAPRDTIELHVWRWTALRDGVLEALQLNHTFTIDSAGTLDLPVIGNIAAAGLREGELAELISDRLQARSGRQERADTTVKLIRNLPSDITGSVEHPGKRKAPEPPADAADDSSSAVASERAVVEKGKAEAQPSVRGSHTPWQPAAEQQQALEGALLNELSAARMEIAAAREEALAARQTARNDAVRHNQNLATARQRAAALVRELDAVRTDRGALEQQLFAALREVEALRKSVQPARGDHEGRELAAARAELAVMQRGARDASAQARAVADTMAEQGQALNQQRRRAEELALDLEVAQREVKGLKAKAILADHEKAARLEARHSMEASVAEAQRALDEERHKAERFERELTVARQTIDALKTSADLAAAAQTNAIKERQVAEAALKRAGDALELERERADSAARDLDSARRERDAAKQEASRVSMELSVALEQERNKAIGLARDLSAARKAIDIEKARDERRTERVTRAPKARAGATSRGDVSARSRPARQPGLRENHKVKAKRPSRPVLVATIALPDALLPTRPPKLGSR
ncbi:polysaccharide biosynthesis/export family protein [Mesorhizobium mediterraneum]|uniref:polysaccharide biosynthesis/export family protein n=1 Tax=Mesorhizobium mediterraneum TaxID=43617 RepID=UPI00177FE3F1|nr:polysaccharide biosynthesis/export family protein [Mesorhizobium mediterraneum]